MNRARELAIQAGLAIVERARRSQDEFSNRVGRTGENGGLAADRGDNSLVRSERLSPVRKPDPTVGSDFPLTQEPPTLGAETPVANKKIQSSEDGLLKMNQLSQPRFAKRYKLVTEEKAGGATYTPTILADFVARQVIATAAPNLPRGAVRILDPAIGDGELLLSMLAQLPSDQKVEVHGFETDHKALDRARLRIGERFPKASIHFREGNFLEFVLEHFDELNTPTFFAKRMSDCFDLIIANPPYVRTQIMGAPKARLLAHRFRLTGRVDLYYAFIMAMARVLNPQGVAGIIVSNRFMTTRSGAAVRAGIRTHFGLRHVWDLGDTKIFEAAVLPCVMLLEGKNGRATDPSTFSSIYETNAPSVRIAINPLAALEHEGVSAVPDGRHFHVRHGRLDISGGLNAIWRIQTKATSDWLETVASHTWGTFRDIGKTRVGVKTCADKVFIRFDWEILPEQERPELLRALTTHHVARQFKALKPERNRLILYPHETRAGPGNLHRTISGVSA